MNPSIPPFAAHLLNFIGDIEAPRGYDTVYGNNQGKLKKRVTEMTIAEVQAAQPLWTKQFGSSATGRYQFMYATLKGLIAEFNLDTSSKFNSDMQDYLGFMLLRRRGYDKFIAGEIGLTTFGKALAQEWASFPVLADTVGAHRPVSRGQSYYAGDGLNKSLVAPERVEAALKTKLPGTGVVAIKKPKPGLPEATTAGTGAVVVAAGAKAASDAGIAWPEIAAGATGALLIVAVVAFIVWKIRKRWAGV